ncbi:MAG: hypothetical protein CMJ18_00070 [Phycisphaeraceae bacterium]|nr:hypothetical protein [Phycisphaeraceae bacterium]
MANGDYFEGEPMRIGHVPQLLLDEHTVEDRWNLTRVSIQPVKFAGNPIMVPDQPGEFNCYDCHVIRDEPRGTMMMWYQDADIEETFRGRLPADPDSAEHHADFCRYAESDNGVHWTKPALGLLKHRGSDRNNIVLAGVKECDRSSIVVNPDPDDVDRHYIMGYLDAPKGESGFCLAYSPDGIHWTPEPRNPVISGHYDCVNTPVWDPIRQRWLWYGRPPVFAFGYSNLAKGWTDADPDSGLARHHRRRVSVSVSRDLVSWSKPRTVLYTDERDADADWHDIDHFRPWFQNGVFLANACYVDPSGCAAGRLMLCWSHDGFHWHRPHDRAWLIEPGPDGAWDSGWVLGASAPVLMGNEMWFYYGAQRSEPHGMVHLATSVGLAKLPRDRFIAQRAGREPGYLLTREVVVEGNRLQLNTAPHAEKPVSRTAMAPMPDLRVELVESAEGRGNVLGGHVIPGFSFDDCDVIRRNMFDCIVTWNGSDDLSALRGRSLHLRFRLSLTSLFTFAFAD